MSDRTIRIGTRGSKMALTQAKQVRSELKAQRPDIETEIVVIETSGDWKPEDGEKPLSEDDGGKGLFAKEIEIALINEQVDIGVHSVKDMPSFLPEGLNMLHYLERDDAYDALVSDKYDSFENLPEGACVGSTSVRRKAYLLHMRPDLKVVNVRGNVTTRIDKMLNGQVDALVLSASGLERIQETEYVKHLFPISKMLPACGQGAIGIEYREVDVEIREILDSIHHRETGLCITAERGALRALNGTCHTPIGAYAKLDGTELELQVSVVRLDGTKVWKKSITEDIHTNQGADDLGFRLGCDIKPEIDPDIL